MTPPPAGSPTPSAIAERALAAGVRLSDDVARTLAEHARQVLLHNAQLHLTTITDPDDFLERHLGEAFEGAAMVPPSVEGTLLDLGSGNGFPGIPLAAARPGLKAVLAEASSKKSEFLRRAILAASLPHRVLESHVTRAGDLDGVGPVALLVTRAMGGWERVVPKLAKCLSPNGFVLIWAGADAEGVFTRVSWSPLVLTATRKLPRRTRAQIYRLDIRN